METLKLPCSEDGEKGLVSSLLLGGDAVSVEINVPKEAFHIPANRLLWKTLCELLAEKKPLDFVIVKQRLIDSKKVEEIGSLEYLSALYNFVPTAANFRHYADIVLDKWRIRRAMLGLREVMLQLEDPENAEWAKLKPSIESCLLRIVSDDDGADEVDAKEMTMRWMEELSTRKERLTMEGIGFGIKALDEMLGQQQPGELVVIGAASSVGKSMLAYQGAIYNAVVRKLPVGVISLEMTALQTWDRLGSHRGRISMTHFRDGEFTAYDAKRLHEIEKELVSAPFHFRSGRLDIDAIQSWARRAKARHEIKLLVVDYLQRVSVGTEMLKRPRQEQVAYISNQLKNLALELGIVVWCPVQLNKESEVRESTAILFDADISMRIILAEDSHTNATIVFDKVRQGQRARSLPIEIEGWFQTITGRSSTEDVPNPEDL
jgi:replicative DNA helicase